MAPVHLVTGDDELLLQRALQRLLDDLTAPDSELEVELHDAVETERLPEMRTSSLFGGRLCVVIRGAERMAADLKEDVEAYLEAPDDQAVLVLVAQGTAKIVKIARLAKQHGEVHEVKTPADWDTAAWQRIVAEEFRRLGREADGGAVRAVLEHAGIVPGVIATRVGQVVAAVAPGRPITAADVNAQIEGHGRQSGFALADAVVDRDAATALTLLRGALEAGDEPLALLGALTFRFRQLSQVRGGADAKSLRLSPGQYRRLQAIAAGNFGVGELGWCHDRLAQLDVDLKGNTELPGDLVLELGVIDLATPREVGAPFNPLAS
jgi:DNA polymerase III subunit delta